MSALEMQAEIKKAQAARAAAAPAKSAPPKPALSKPPARTGSTGTPPTNPVQQSVPPLPLATQRSPFTLR